MPLRVKRTLLIAVLLLGGAFSCFAQTGYLSVNAFPAATVADGHSSISIRATLTQSNGSAVPDGTEVLFTTDMGHFTVDTVTTKQGIAQATLVPGNVVGTATVTVKALGLSVAPQNLSIDFVLDRDQLNSTKDFVEIVSQKPLQFSPAVRKIQAEDLEHKVSLRYRGTTIEAEKLELNLETYELRAIRAKVTVNRVERNYAQLNLHLDTRSGYGITTVKEDEITEIAGVGRVPIFKSQITEHYGLAEIKGSKVRALHGYKFDSYFAIEDFEDQPAMITAKKAVVYRNKEVQFQNAVLYAGDSKVMTLPLCRAPLTGDKRLFTEQIINVNDNQVAITYPYYLSLKPGETSFLRFHLGDNGMFGTSNRPQLDYQIDWARGSENYGGFLLGGVGQSEWGLEVHQYYRFDGSTTGFAQLISPATRSINGSTSLTHTISGGYSMNLNSSLTQSFIGDNVTDQSTALNLQRDPIKVGDLPFRLSYGLVASHVATTAPIAIQKQDAFGTQAQLTMLEQKLDNTTHLDGGLTMSHLMGSNVSGGLTFGANLFLKKRIEDVNLGIGYSFTQDPLQSERVGQHQVSAVTSYEKGNTALSFHGSTALDITNIQYSSSLRYRVKKLWSLAYTSSFYRYIGTTFLDYNFGVFYSYLGNKQAGIIWSHVTHRFGFQLYGD